MESHRLAAVIPAFNESDTIYDVVAGVKNFCDVFVVDDRSSDETFNIANKAGAKVYKNQGKSGYENALNFGYSKVSNLGYDYILTIDADGQHEPKYIEKFLTLISSEEPSIIIAQRTELPRITEIIFSKLTTKIFGISDAFSGFKCYKVEDFSNLNFSDYKLTGMNFLNMAIALKEEVITFDISIQKRKDEPRFGNSLKSNLILMRSVINFFLILTIRKILL